MGEVMARHRGLAGEFATILLPYIREDGNLLEYELLQRGVLWGIGRLAQVRPELLRLMSALSYLFPDLQSRDSTVRRLAVWAIGLIGGEESRFELGRLLEDVAAVSLYRDQTLITRRVHTLPREALKPIKGRRSNSSQDSP